MKMADISGKKEGIPKS